MAEQVKINESRRFYDVAKVLKVAGIANIASTILLTGQMNWEND